MNSYCKTKFLYIIPSKRDTKGFNTVDGAGKMPEKTNIYLFLDAEGTLFLPKKGLSYLDFWDGERTLDKAKEVFELDPSTIKVLEELKRMGITMYIVSKHEEAVLPSLLEHFGIRKFFKEVLINGDKGLRIKKQAAADGIPLERCLMVGDMYSLDIAPCLREGIKCYLLDRKYNRKENAPRLKSLYELLKVIIS